MKHLLKKIFIVPVMGVTILINISGNKSNWVGMNLSTEEISNSIHFQLLRGGTCIGEFEKLQPILDRFILKKTNAAYLKNILGTPNKILAAKNQTQLQYNLTSNLNSYQLNLITQNGDLISYKIENSL